MPNLYPAFERQEVVVHTPRHARSVAELSDDELAGVAEAWRRRREAVPDGYLHALVNEGREAGSSLPHTHSQLVWLPEPPPETQEQVDRERWSVVAERDGLVLACPWASRLAYELVIAPAEPRAGAFADELLPAALALLGDAVRRIHRAAGAVPLNAWLHDSADWHIEILPRLSILAGVEPAPDGGSTRSHPRTPQRRCASSRSQPGRGREPPEPRSPRGNAEPPRLPHRG